MLGPLATVIGLIVFPFLSDGSADTCCRKKEFGGSIYNFNEYSSDPSIMTTFGCIDLCVFQLGDDASDIYCFKREGNINPTCLIEANSTVTEQTVLTTESTPPLVITTRSPDFIRRWHVAKRDFNQPGGQWENKADSAHRTWLSSPNPFFFKKLK